MRRDIMTTRWHAHLTSLSLVICLIQGLGACASSSGSNESWNSYYYGTGRKSVGGVYYDKDDVPKDNDDSYALPRGYWQDDQVPQGQRY